MEINQNVRNIRESKGVTQTHVAKQLGVTIQTYNAYEMGRRKLKVDTLQKISEILNEPIQNFFNQKLYETKNKQIV
jgi:transcriptional regulator with XRE-family HTH domain